MTFNELTPGSQRLAGAEVAVVSRRGDLPSSGIPSHAGGPTAAGQHGRAPSPTSQVSMVAASLLLGDATERHACYPRRTPGTPRHA
jgi:hypothetical protein